MAKVAVIKCDTYNYDKVKSAVKKGIELLGGIEKFVSKNEKVLLKPNLLMGFAPEKCTTTHPAVFNAVIELFKEKCSKLSYGDSPGFGSPEGVASKAGLKTVAKKHDVEIGDFVKGKDVFFEQGVFSKKFLIANAVLNNDAVISIPKLKTHGFQKFTGSIKNQFGCIPGLTKPEYHVKLPGANDFAKMLVDLDRFVKPRLYIMDGIQAMEGNGPSGGTPVNMNIILLSADPVALDSVVCGLINVDPEKVPTIKYGKEFGRGTYLENEIEIVGDNIEEFKNINFDIDRTEIKPYKETGFVKFISNRFIPKPFIDNNKCVKCGVCINVCPIKPNALNWHNNDKKNPPVYNYRNCIRCFCCQELCPENAIKIKKPIIRKIFSKR